MHKHDRKAIQTSHTPQHRSVTQRASKRAAFKRNCLAASIFALISPFASALPEGLSTEIGALQIDGNTSEMTITQTTPFLVLKWSDFSIGENEKVTFHQPNQNALVVNRVDIEQGLPSNIHGQLEANGRVWLINPTGITLGRGASINVGSFVASTLAAESDNAYDDPFVVLSKVASASSLAPVKNEGNITTNSGLIALLGGRVTNDGVIQSSVGIVTMASGSVIVLGSDQLPMLGIVVEGQNNPGGKVINLSGGKISAPGVVLKASATTDPFENAVINHGIIEATTIESGGNFISLLGSGTSGVSVSGTLDVSRANGPVGIYTEGSKISISDEINLKIAEGTNNAVTWSLGSPNFTVDTNTGSITGSTLSRLLESADITVSGTPFLETPNTIAINDEIAWQAATNLELNATAGLTISRDIRILGANGSLGLNGNPALDRGARITFEDATHTKYRLYINQEDYELIGSLSQLQNIDLEGRYALAYDIDASATKLKEDPVVFRTIGAAEPLQSPTSFTGVLDGLGHEIKGLYVNRGPLGTSGLISINAGQIRNIGLTDVEIYGGNVGGIAAENQGIISRSYVTGSIYHVAGGGGAGVGGLVGINFKGTLTDVFAEVDVSGEATQGVGGLVGFNFFGVVERAYVSGYSNPSGNAQVKGAIGVGGLVGSIQDGRLTDVHVSADVSAPDGSGLLIGSQAGTTVVESAIASGSVNSNATEPPLVGEIRGELTSDQMFALDASQRIDRKYYETAGFDFANHWRIYEGFSTPLLKTFLKPLTVTVNDIDKPYDANPFIGTLTYTLDRQPWDLRGTLMLSPGNLQFVDVGSYPLNGVGLWSRRDDIEIVAGKLTINRAQLILAATAYEKIYDGTSLAVVPNTNFEVRRIRSNIETSLPDGQAISYSPAFTYIELSSPDVSENGLNEFILALQSSDFEFSNGALAKNYLLPESVSVTVKTVPRDLTVGLRSGISKVYDGTDVAPLTADRFQIEGLVAGQSMALSDLPSQARYQSVNVGSEIPIVFAPDTPAPTLMGGPNTLASNYRFATYKGTTGVITPAVLTYTANPAETHIGDPLPELTGQVTGFVNGETLATATSGTLRWRVADTDLHEGRYSILGEGLTANFGNYVFVQSPSNVAALTVTQHHSCSHHGQVPVRTAYRAVGSSHGMVINQLTPGTSANWLSPPPVTVPTSGGSAC